MLPPFNLHHINPAQLETWVEQIKQQSERGELPSYIPKLANAQSNWLAVEIQTLGGDRCTFPQDSPPFVFMSVIKPFLLLYALETAGAQAVFSKVGQQPSQQAFNSITQLEQDQGFPRNPMLNSGAIALTEFLGGSDGFTAAEALRQWLNHISGSHFEFDLATLASVQSLPNQANWAIAQRLHQAGSLSQPAHALEAYNYICCLQTTAHALCGLGLRLSHPQPNTVPIHSSHAQIVNQLMLTCGLYQTSAQYAQEIGWPIKSGVSGALLAVIPNQGAIAIYSPPLDSYGNSIIGLELLKRIATRPS